MSGDVVGSVLSGVAEAGSVSGSAAAGPNGAGVESMSVEPATSVAE